jgi:hypothetical protein
LAWHVRSSAVELVNAKDSGNPSVKKIGQRTLGALKYELFEGFFKHHDDYITVATVAQACGYPVERLKSSVMSGLNQGQLDRMPLDGAYGYRLTAKGLEALENERRRRQSPGIRPEENADA